jgi:hypothetical protein
VFKVTHPLDSATQVLILGRPEDVADAELADSEPGDQIQIEVVEMSEEEFAALPEFEGW